MKAKARKSKKLDPCQTSLPDNPASPPSAMVLVLEVSADDAGRVRRWAAQDQDRSIRVKIEGAKLSLQGITPEELWTRVSMFEVFGVADPTLQFYLARQVKGCFFPSALAEGKLDDQYTETIRVVRAVLPGLAPRDTVEALLATQMVGAHNAAMDAIRQAARMELPLEFRKHYANYAVKMRRLFLEQVEALRKHRGGGQQQVVVKYVQVNEGGQAIVGHIDAGRHEGPGGRA